MEVCNEPLMIELLDDVNNSGVVESMYIRGNKATIKLEDKQYIGIMINKIIAFFVCYLPDAVYEVRGKLVAITYNKNCYAIKFCS